MLGAVTIGKPLKGDLEWIEIRSSTELAKQRCGMAQCLVSE